MASGSACINTGDKPKGHVYKIWVASEAEDNLYIDFGSSPSDAKTLASKYKLSTSAGKAVYALMLTALTTSYTVGLWCVDSNEFKDANILSY